MNRPELLEKLQRFGESAQHIAGIALLGTGTAGAAIGAGYGGYRLGESIAPNAHTIPGKIFEHAVEATSAGILGVVGGFIGFAIGVLIADGGLTEFLEGQA